MTEEKVRNLKALSTILKRAPYLTEFAKVTDIPSITCYKWAQDGKLPAMKVNGRWVVRLKDIDDWQPPQGANHKLTQAEAEDIRKRATREDVSQAQLAREFDMSESSISNIINHKTYP